MSNLTSSTTPSLQTCKRTALAKVCIEATSRRTANRERSRRKHKEDEGSPGCRHRLIDTTKPAMTTRVPAKESYGQKQKIKIEGCPRRASSRHCFCKGDRQRGSLYGPAAFLPCRHSDKSKPAAARLPGWQSEMRLPRNVKTSDVLPLGSPGARFRTRKYDDRASSDQYSEGSI